MLLCFQKFTKSSEIPEKILFKKEKIYTKYIKKVSNVIFLLIKNRYEINAIS